MPELPSVPPDILRRLKEYDPDLDLVLNLQEGLWEVREWIPQAHRWSHCFYWHDGPWSAKVFKPLPYSAEPLLAKLGSIDWARTGGSAPQRLKEMKAKGAEKRAKAMEVARDEWRRKMAEYINYAKNNWDQWRRMRAQGGRAKEQAERARTDAAREIIYDGKVPGE